MRINTNLTAMNTYTQYTKNNNKIASSVEKLSSGYSINSAADNAAGLAISEKMRAQIRGLEQASSNSQDAISLVQTAEGALGSATEILQRMREIAVQSSSDTNNDEIDRTALQDEFSQLQSELDDISSTTTFNKKNLLDGSLSSTKSSLSNVDLANSSMAVSVGSAAAGTYSFSVSTKLESAAVEGKKGTTTASLGSTASATFSDCATTNPTSASALYNGNYTLSTTVNQDGSLTVTATGDNDQAFTATVSKAALTAVNSDNFNASNSSHNGITLNFASANGSTDGFSTVLTLKSAVSTSSNGLDSLSDALGDVTVSIDGGVDAQDATYGVYASLTGGESVKLHAGDTSATFSNGVTVSFDKLTATDVAVKTETASVAGYTNAFTTSSDTVDIASAFSGLTAGATLDLEVTAGTLSDGTTDLSGSRLSVLSVAANTAGDGQTITLTDGTNNYTANVTYAGIEAAGTNAMNLTFVSDNGSNLTATLTASADQSSQTVGATGAFANDSDADTLGEIDSTASDSITQTITKYSYAVDTEDNAAVDISAYFETSDASQVASGTASLKVTGMNVAESLDNNLGSLSLTGITDDGTNYTFTLEDANGTEYSATVASANIEDTATDYAETLTFADASGNTITADFILAGGQGVAAVNTTDPGDTALASTTATAHTVAASTETVATLSNGVVSKMGKDTDTGASKTTNSIFTVNKAANAGLTFQVGANENDELTINLDRVDSEYLGVSSSKVTTQEAASAAITAVDDAINNVSAQRAYLGAIQNRLDYKISNLDTSSENLTAAESQIRDVDMAKEMTNFTNANILQQAATAMLAQANSLPQNVLSLIG